MCHKARKKPVVIDFVIFEKTEKSVLEIYKFVKGKDSVNLKSSMDHEKFSDYANDIIRSGFDINTLEGTMKAMPGDYIIRGVNGENYPCKPDIFEKTYEIVSTPSPQGGDKQGKALEWDSYRLIGRVRERFKELEAKGWDWRSFYNGWLEGRADMYGEIKGIKQPSQPPSEAGMSQEDERRDLLHFGYKAGCIDGVKHKTTVGVSNRFEAWYAHGKAVQKWATESESSNPPPTTKEEQEDNLPSRFREYLNKTSAEDMIKDFEAMGYEFEDIQPDPTKASSPQGEVPEEIIAELWEKEKLSGHGLAGAYRLGAITIYHRMQEEIKELSDKLKYERHCAKEMQNFQTDRIMALQSQLSSYQTEIADYRKALEEIQEICGTIGRPIAFSQQTPELISALIKKILAKYSPKAQEGEK